eukprot:2127137-Prymnesium_polylepis.1
MLHAKESRQIKPTDAPQPPTEWRSPVARAHPACGGMHKPSRVKPTAPPSATMQLIAAFLARTARDGVSTSRKKIGDSPSARMYRNAPVLDGIHT